MSAAFAHAALSIAGALFDSLWEGALIAGTVWLGLRCLPKLGAATRYAIWLCALASLVLIPLLSVGLSEQIPPQLSDAAVTGGQRAVIIAPLAQPRTTALRAAPEPAVVESEPAPVGPHKSRITISQELAVAAAIVWVLVACARGFLLLLDVRALAVIRRDASSWSSAHDYPVLLSDRVQVPIAAGFLRPAIVLPTSLVERLPDAAVQAIVIHEVAHLRRYDVWTNALARLAETFLVLNPVAWFVMRRLSMEREIACDDWVVARTGAGDAFARVLATLAGIAGARMPLAAPSALGSRHSIVVRIERLLDSAPRRLRLSPTALGGALVVLALIAFTLQSVSPVLAYDSPQALLAQRATKAPAAAGCFVPNRGITMTYLLGKARRTANTPPDDSVIPEASVVVKRLGAANTAIFDLRVDAAGKATSVVLVSPPKYPEMGDALRRVFMATAYKPALHNCVPVTTTIRTAIPASAPEASTMSVIAPAYPAGWSDQHASACKVPTVSRGRFRPGFDKPTAYTNMLPAFPDSMKNMPLGSKYKTSVRVHVNAAGAATSAALVSSSGRSVFDDSVLTAARNATYPLSASTCSPLPTEYVWQTTFERTTVLYFIAHSTNKMGPAPGAR